MSSSSSSENKKRGIKPKEIDQEIIDEVVRLRKLTIPLKYIGILCNISGYFVKRILKENPIEPLVKSEPEPEPEPEPELVKSEPITIVYPPEQEDNML